MMGRVPKSSRISRPRASRSSWRRSRTKTRSRSSRERAPGDVLSRSILNAGLALAAVIALAGCGKKPEGPQHTRVGIVAKSLGNGFFDAVHKGANEAAKELDAVVYFVGPTTPTAEGQIEVLNALIAQHVDAIAISANDPDAVVPTLKRAMARGIKVVSYDSAVAGAGRNA